MRSARSFSRQHWRQWIAIKAPPESVALGFALGVFLGFTPFFGLKTLLALLLAWLLRSNKLAAFLGVTLHDVLLPFMPALLRLEYQLGYWSLNRPHHFAPKMHLRHEHLHVPLHWTEVFASAKPLLVGSIIVGLPLAFASYFIVRAVLFKTERTAAARVNSKILTKTFTAQTCPRTLVPCASAVTRRMQSLGGVR